jgi:hypothetical protein
MSGAKLYSRRLTAPSGLRVDGTAGLTPWAPRVLPVIGFALQAGSGLPPSGVIKHRCAGDVGALRAPFCMPLRGSAAFAAGRRHVYWRRRRRTSPAQRYYITPWAEGPEPIREAPAGPG